MGGVRWERRVWIFFAVELAEWFAPARLAGVASDTKPMRGHLAEGPFSLSRSRLPTRLKGQEGDLSVEGEIISSCLCVYTCLHDVAQR